MSRHPFLYMFVFLIMLIFFTLSCAARQEERGAPDEDERMREARMEAMKAIEEAEVLMQGAQPGTDLSDARELLDQARALCERAVTPEQLTGSEGSVLELVEEAKRKAREAMQARSGR